MTYHPIHSYGLIGDMNSAALVSVTGSVDWACFPRFDTGSVFAAILDETKGGHFSLAPSGPAASGHRYRGETTILETTFESDAGHVTVIDFMVNAATHRAEAPHEIVRIVQGDRGEVAMRAVFEPRLDFARGTTEFSTGSDGVSAKRPGMTLRLVSGVPFDLERAPDGGQRAVAEFVVREGQTFEFIVAYGEAPEVPVHEMAVPEKLAHTETIWRDIVSRIDYDGPWRGLVVRSALTLHLLTYDPTGAIVAAPTTSLPEFIGGARNWDYRFSWLRDAAWTVGILYRLGEAREGEEYLEWLVAQCRLGLNEMQILYGVAKESGLEENELGHLEGYRQSAPVRIGNGAAHHRQLDVLGEIVLSIATYEKHVGPMREDWWELVAMLADLASRVWGQADNGMWEVRGPRQHFVSSKLMCWVALDRAARMGEARGDKRTKRWRREADKVHADILVNGWSEAKQSFVQRYGADNLDASVLLVPFVGFLPAGDPRVESTVRAVQRELADGPFVRRYLTHETDDGFSESEGAFFMLSFWLVGALAMIGAHDEAREMFDEVVSKASPLGLFAEMWDPIGNQALGNFPQALSHIGFLHTARNMSQLPGADEKLLG